MTPSSCDNQPPRLDPAGPIHLIVPLRPGADLEQLRARAAETGAAEFGLECALRPVAEPVLEAAREAARAIAAVEVPLLALSRHLEDILDEEAAELDGAARARIEGSLRGLDRRARMTLPG